MITWLSVLLRRHVHRMVMVVMEMGQRSHSIPILGQLRCRCQLVSARTANQRRT